MIDVGPPVGANFGGAKYAHGLLDFSLSPGAQKQIGEKQQRE
jgi:hypothetical protein